VREQSLAALGGQLRMLKAQVHSLCQDGHWPWLTALLARRPTKVAAITLGQQDRQDGLGHDGQRRAL